MTEHCPTCAGPRVTDDPDRLVAYVHEAWCALALAERETWDEDRARHRRYRTAVRHRPTTQAERMLLAASGVRLQPGPLFTRVQWQDGTRTRTWRRQPVVSVTDGAYPQGGTPSHDLGAGTVREADKARRDAPALGSHGGVRHA